MCLVCCKARIGSGIAWGSDGKLGTFSPCRRTTLLRSGFADDVTFSATSLAVSAIFEAVFFSFFSTVATGVLAATTLWATARFD